MVREEGQDGVQYVWVPCSYLEAVRYCSNDPDWRGKAPVDTEGWLARMWKRLRA
jgi:hypothetical protein